MQLVSNVYMCILSVVHHDCHRYYGYPVQFMQGVIQPQSIDCQSYTDIRGIPDWMIVKVVV